MEDLLRSLRNLGLCPPSTSQLWQLLDDDDEEVQARLIKLLAFNAAPDPSTVEGDDEDRIASASSSVAALMGHDLLQEAVAALLDNFRRTLARQRETARREEEALKASVSFAKTNGSTVKAKRVKLAPRKALLARQAAALRKDEEERKHAGNYRPRLVFDGSTSFYSTAVIGDLQQIDCNAMLSAPARHQGAYLLCRVVTQLLLYVGVTFVVEDQNGIAMPVSVSHFTSDINLSTEEVSQLLPVGTIVAIKEPFLSIDHQARAGPCAGKADIGIRVDSPTDIIVLRVDDELLNDVHWSNEELAVPPAMLDAALPWLTDANLANEDCGNYTSLAQRFFDADRIGAAYRTTLRGDKAGDSVDAELRGRILFRLGAWKEAGKAFSSVAGSSAADVEADDRRAGDFSIPLSQLTASQCARRSAIRQAQSLQGLTLSDVRSIFFAPNEMRRLDTSDFVGPVAVQDIPNAGRGLVTTRDVDVGELLFCCRAIGSAYPDDKQSRGSPLMRLNLSNGVVSATSQVRAQTNLIHAIADRPELANAVLGLTAGPNIPYSRFVSQPFPVSTNPTLDAKTALNLERPCIDAAYIDGVLRFNAFGPAQSPSRSTTVDDDGGELAKSTMPHPLPAILNHACLANVSSIFFADIVTTRPLTRLPKGTEIVHQYVRGEEPYAIRAAQLSKHGFVCGCTLCQLDRADGQEMLTARARIVQGEARAVFERSRVLMKSVDVPRLGAPDALLQKDALDAHMDILDALWQLQQRVQDTYAKGRTAFRPDLFTIMEARIKHLALVDVQAALDVVVEAMACVGGQVDASVRNCRQGVLRDSPRLHMDGAISLLLRAAVLHANARDLSARQEHNDWTQAAYWAHASMIGGGLDVFLDRYSGAPAFAHVLQSFTPIL